MVVLDSGLWMWLEPWVFSLRYGTNSYVSIKNDGYTVKKLSTHCMNIVQCMVVIKFQNPYLNHFLTRAYMKMVDNDEFMLLEKVTVHKEDLSAEYNDTY